MTLAAAVETQDVVRGLRRYGLTQRAIAVATGATERSVRNWEAARGVRGGHEDRLRELQEIVVLLEDSLTPRGVGQWLRARQRALDGRRPIELLQEGQADRVRQAAQAFIDGVYV